MSGAASDKKQESNTQEMPWPNPTYAWYVVLVLTFAYTLSFIDRQIISLMVGPIKEDLQITDFQISLLQGLAFASFYTFLGLPLGRLADRLNRSKIIAWGLFTWSLMTVACGLAKNYTHLFLARVGVGVGEATLSPCAYSLISDYFPKERLARALSVYFMGVYIGTGLAYILGGYVIELVSSMDDIHMPIIGQVSTWQATFIAVGAPGILYLILIKTIKEPARRGLLKKEGTDDSADISILDALKYMFQRWRLYILLSASMGFHAILGYASGAWVPEYMIRTFPITITEAAYTYGLIVLFFSTAGVFAGGWLADWLEDRGYKDAKVRSMAFGLIIVLPLTIIFPLMPTYESSLVVLVFAAFFISFPYGSAAASLQVVTPNQMRGLVTAGYLFIINIIGLAFGPSITAAFTDFVFADPLKLNWSLALTSAVAIPPAILCILGARKPFLRALEANKNW